MDFDINGNGVILLAAAYLTVVSLTRLMLARRSRLVADFRQQMLDEQRRKKQPQKKASSKRAA